MRESGSDIDNWTLGGISIIVAALIAATVLFLQAVVYRWESQELAKKTVTPQTLRDYRSEQATRLSEYGWADREKGMVRIPIERALEVLSTKPQAADR